MKLFMRFDLIAKRSTTVSSMGKCTIYSIYDRIHHKIQINRIKLYTSLFEWLWFRTRFKLQYIKFQIISSSSKCEHLLWRGQSHQYVRNNVNESILWLCFCNPDGVSSNDRSNACAYETKFKIGADKTLSVCSKFRRHKSTDNKIKNCAQSMYVRASIRLQFICVIALSRRQK